MAPKKKKDGKPAAPKVVEKLDFETRVKNLSNVSRRQETKPVLQPCQ